MAETHLLEDLAGRLERAATQLRDRTLGADRAAALVDECARLAAEAGAELDRHLRAAEGAGPAPGQLALGSTARQLALGPQIR
jgi:hypothetical protein